jgi:hypothetical protein
MADKANGRLDCLGEIIHSAFLRHVGEDAKSPRSQPLSRKDPPFPGRISTAGQQRLATISSVAASGML